MQRRAIAALVSGLWLASSTFAATIPPSQRKQELTPSPDGPFHVAGNRIIDSHNHPFLMRGTQLTEFRFRTAAQDSRSGAGLDFGPHSPTSLSAIRLIFNMNTVRLPVSAEDAGRPEYFPELAKLVQRANQIDLFVVLAPVNAPAEFWSKCAAFFKDYRNVMFDVGDGADMIKTIRTAGAAQPVAVTLGNRVEGPGIIYEVSPSYRATRTDSDRDAQFGSMADHAPVYANGLDLNLGEPAECAVIPSDPAEASKLVQGNLDYFDTHQISWTISVYEPGKLVKDLSLQDATSLEHGWTCGQPEYPQAGLGRLIEAHLRAIEERGLFIVSAGGGGPDIARGGFALAYGPVMAQKDSQAPAHMPLPKTLGNISVEITDSRGITRRAGLSWASAGWGQVNFVVPPESAPGPARMTIVRWDGSRKSTFITVADTAPGFWTGMSCRGPARGTANQVFANGRRVKSDLSTCKGDNCKTLVIPMAKGAVTRLQMDASGFRNARGAGDIEVTAGGVRLPVVSFGPGIAPGVDQVTVEIPDSLRGAGDLDVIAHVNGRVSNAVQIRIGS